MVLERPQAVMTCGDFDDYLRVITDLVGDSWPAECWSRTGSNSVFQYGRQGVVVVGGRSRCRQLLGVPQQNMSKITRWQEAYSRRLWIASWLEVMIMIQSL